jgi:site-specific DNA-cytosine methylase
VLPAIASFIERLLVVGGATYLAFSAIMSQTAQSRLAALAHDDDGDDQTDLLSEATVESSAAPLLRRKKRLASGSQGGPRKGKGKSSKRKKPLSSPSFASCESEDTELADDERDVDAAAPVQLNAKSSVPKTSSLFDFADHLVGHVLSDTERNALMNSSFSFAELGAGYATATMCSEALRIAFNKVNAQVNGTCVFYTEQQDWKRDIIKEIHKRVMPDAPCCMFVNTGDVSKPILVTDSEASIAKLPSHKFAFFAIECDDVSLCSNTPRSVTDPSGKSGASFLEFLDYLKSMRFQDCPDAIMVECVKNLDHVRKKIGGEKGTDVVTAALSEIGYVGSWQALNAIDFYLPQSRPRAYGVFLRLSKGLGPKGKEMRQKDLDAVWDFVKRCKTKPKFERLDVLCSRLALGPPDGNQNLTAEASNQKKARSPNINSAKVACEARQIQGQIWDGWQRFASKCSDHAVQAVSNSIRPNRS